MATFKESHPIPLLVQHWKVAGTDPMIISSPVLSYQSYLGETIKSHNLPFQHNHGELNRDETEREREYHWCASEHSVYVLRFL